ncbi:MAG: hypothetical protein V1907_01990 [Candidatus Kerfeldbacteria bacterium]
MRTRRATIVGIVIVIVGIARFAFPAHSTLLSPGATQRLSVYGGIVTITPGDTMPDGTERALALGSLGTDITSNDDIILQPGGTDTTGTRFIGTEDGLLQNLAISGNLSFETVGKEACIKGVCRSSWSRVPEHWQSVTLSYSGGQRTVLQPININEGARIGTSTQRFTNGTALTADGLFATNRSGGNAATIGGTIENIQALTVYDKVTISYREPWSQKNQGAGTGLDADTIDGAGVTLSPGYICDATACVCFYGRPTNHQNSLLETSDTLPYRCIRLFATSASPY